MNTSHIPLRERIETLEQQVEPLPELFRKFRAYTNLHLGQIYESIAELQNKGSTQEYQSELAAIRRHVIQLENDIKEFKHEYGDEAASPAAQDVLSLTVNELKQLANVLNRFAERVEATILDKR
jgi:uncharacterized damage-inducible protein DinB